MKTSFPRCGVNAFALLLCLLLGHSFASAATNKKPVLISQATSTRAVAFESVTMKAEPFALTASVPSFGADPRTRICIFAMDLELLPGEGANAFTSDVQDANGKIYPLRVEYAGQVPNFPGITMIIVRLSDDLTNVGDVLQMPIRHGEGCYYADDDTLAGIDHRIAAGQHGCHEQRCERQAPGRPSRRKAAESAAEHRRRHGRRS